MKKIFAIFSTIAVLLTTGATSAFAAPNHPNFGSFLNDGGVPAGSQQVLNVVYKVTNDEDSGFFGYWALDNYTKHVQVWQTPDQSFYAVVRYDGKWQTFAGALSPENGKTEGSNATGTMQGGYTATFTADSCIPTHGNIGSYDLGGTKADILLGTYGAGQVGNTNSFDWLSTYCTNAANFTQPQWGWTYKYKDQIWNNFYNGSSGDILIP